MGGNGQAAFLPETFRSAFGRTDAAETIRTAIGGGLPSVRFDGEKSVKLSLSLGDRDPVAITRLTYQTLTNQLRFPRAAAGITIRQNRPSGR